MLIILFRKRFKFYKQRSRYCLFKIYHLNSSALTLYREHLKNVLIIPYSDFPGSDDRGEAVCVRARGDDPGGGLSVRRDPLPALQLHRGGFQAVLLQRLLHGLVKGTRQKLQFHLQVTQQSIYTGTSRAHINTR